MPQPSSSTVSTWPQSFCASEQRTLFSVYYIRDDDVWAVFWHAPGIVNGPFQVYYVAD